MGPDLYAPREIHYLRRKSISPVYGDHAMNANRGRVTEVVDRAQALTRKLLGKAPNASVEAFLAERKREAERDR
ncbi:MAG TPA: hypothetical protein VE309_14500 [Caulobacteraceae bacterium]|nr:hypothetical protein [Caulobacteraceae bacterium]